MFSTPTLSHYISGDWASEGDFAGEAADFDDIDAVGGDVELGDACRDCLGGDELAEDGVYLDVGGAGHIDYNCKPCSLDLDVGISCNYSCVGAVGLKLLPLGGVYDLRGAAGKQRTA